MEQTKLHPDFEVLKKWFNNPKLRLQKKYYREGRVWQDVRRLGEITLAILRSNTPVCRYRIANKHQDLIDKWEASGRTLKVKYYHIDDDRWYYTTEPSWYEDYEYMLEEPEQETPEEKLKRAWELMKGKELSYNYSEYMQIEIINSVRLSKGTTIVSTINNRKIGFLQNSVATIDGKPIYEFLKENNLL